MFDIAFSELVIIALVALVVVGPERLPKVARTAGILLGRLQRYVSDVKADIHREIQIDELKKMQDDVATQVRSMEQSVSEQMKTVETELNQSIAAGIEEKSAVAAEAAAPQAESAAVLPAAAETAPPAADAIVATATEKPHA